MTALADVVAASHQISATRARNAKLDRLAAVLRGQAPGDAALAASYLSGELPQGKIGVGYALVSELASGPAASATSLTLAEIDATYSEIAAQHGAGSGRARKELLGRLLARATPDERDFLAALTVGELRQGALAALIGEALARAHEVPPVEVRRAMMIAGAIGPVARALAQDGRAGLAAFAIAPLRPLLPMLAHVADDVDDAIARLGEAAFEHKLDGARVQIHRDGDEVRVFSRGGLDFTAAVPEAVAIARALPARRAILDGEAIALKPDRRPYPFQTTMSRFSRSEPAADPLSVFVFDCLLLDDDLVLDRPTRDRLAALDAIVGEAHRVPRLVTADPAAAAAFLGAAFAAGHEGVMAKALDAPYDAGNRGASWLKLKKVHTLDLVILAVEWGSGRRKGLLSNLHLGARDPVNGGFVMLGKTFKGLTDETLAWQTRELLAREIGRDGHVVHVRPELVAEIAFSDVQISSQYPGGLSLRLARLIRYRPDRRGEDADTIDAVRAIAVQDGVVDG